MVSVWTLNDLNKQYKIDLDKIVLEIKKINVKRIMLQFPDGLKPYATSFVDYLQSKVVGKEFFIWLGSCFGACDYPVGIEGMDIDLVIQIGHNNLMPNYLTI